MGIDEIPQHATLALILESNAIWLGLKRDSEIGNGLYNGPGGKCEPGESAEACIIRECWEEFNIDVTRDDLEHVAVLECHVTEPERRCVQIVDVFIIRDYVGDVSISKSMRPRKFPFDEIPYDQMHQADQRWLPKALAGMKFHAQITYRTKGEGLIAASFGPYQTARDE